MEREQSSSMWIGMAVGLVVGAASALLLAPMKGSETRGKIKDSYGGAVDKVKNLSETGKQKVQELRSRRGSQDQELAMGAPRTTTEEVIRAAQERAEQEQITQDI